MLCNQIYSLDYQFALLYIHFQNLGSFAFIFSAQYFNLIAFFNSHKYIVGTNFVFPSQFRFAPLPPFWQGAFGRELSRRPQRDHLILVKALATGLPQPLVGGPLA